MQQATDTPGAQYSTMKLPLPSLLPELCRATTCKAPRKNPSKRHLQPRTIPPPPPLSSSSSPAPPSFVGRSGGAVLPRCAPLSRQSLNPHRLVVGLPLHLQGNSIHTLSALDSSLLAARQALPNIHLALFHTEASTTLSPSYAAGMHTEAHKELQLMGKFGFFGFQLSPKVSFSTAHVIPDLCPSVYLHPFADKLSNFLPKSLLEPQ